MKDGEGEHLNKKQAVWKPVYIINSAIARALMDIEAAKAVVENISNSHYGINRREHRE